MNNRRIAASPRPASPSVRCRAPRLTALAVVAVTVLGASGLTAVRAHAADIQIAGDQLRTGWYPDQGALDPATVGGGSFGQLYSASINGQEDGQPVVLGSTVVVATETNDVYGLNNKTGQANWHLTLGVPWNPADLACGDISPWVGVTATPVIDAATSTVYLTSKTYVSGTSGPAQYWMHALDVATGQERAGFPVVLQGIADNDPTHTFNPTTQLQRPGLIELNGVIYAGFGGHCDRKAYEGWVMGVSTAGSVTARWTTEAGQDPSTSPGAGIWQSDGGLVSDGPGQLLLTTGNGTLSPTPVAGNHPPGALGQAVVRLGVQADGTLLPTDFFSPYDAASLNQNDSDLGSGAPFILPSQFGTATYPELALQVGKQGYMYLLDAHNLGGMGQGPGGGDAIINRLGPNGGLWGKPTVWPGDGGYVYETTAQGGGGTGRLKAFKYSLDGAGKPTLAQTGLSPDLFGFGSSAPLVTSFGTQSGTALVWVVWSPNGSGQGAQLRAYDPVPVGGTLNLRFSAPIGTATKFANPAVDNGRIYVGTRDGHLLCFGSPVPSALSGRSLIFPRTNVGTTAHGTATLTASTSMVVNAVTTDTSVFAVTGSTPAVPATLNSGDTLTVNVDYSPTAVTQTGGRLLFNTTAGSIALGVQGEGRSPNASPSSSPPVVTFEGVVAGGPGAQDSVTFSNVGGAPMTVTGATLPSAPYAVSGVPANGTVIGPDQSVTVSLTFSPTTPGQYNDSITLGTDAGDMTVPIDGTSGAPPRLVISTHGIQYGRQPVGTAVRSSFTLTNQGGTDLTVTKSKPPSSNVGFTAVSTLAESSVIPAGQTVTETVEFTPLAAATASDTWVINTDDGSGVQTITFTGSGATGSKPSVMALAATIAQPAAGTSAVASVPVVLNLPSATTITVPWSTADGTALAASGDYVPASGNLVFNPGETSHSIPVTVNGTGRHGADTTVTVKLGTVSGVTGGRSSVKLTVVNTFGLTSATVGDASVAQPAAGTTSTLQFPVSLNATPAAGESIAVTVATADGTGVAGTDYVAVPATTLTFTSATGPTQIVPVTVKATGATGNRTVLLNLSGKAATIGDKQAVGTIVAAGQAAPLPSLSISDLPVVRPVTGTVTAAVTLTLSAPSSLPVTVTWATKDLTATAAAADYVAVPATKVTFAPGETSKTLPVTVNGNGLHNGTRAFYTNLSRPVNATLADASATVTIINTQGKISIYVPDGAVTQDPVAGENLTYMAVLTLSSAPAPGEVVTAVVSTLDGTASSGAGDYDAQTSVVVTFAAGQATTTFPVVLHFGPASEVGENFSLSASSATSVNAVIGRGKGLIGLQSH